MVDLIYSPPFLCDDLTPNVSIANEVLNSDSKLSRYETQGQVRPMAELRPDDLSCISMRWFSPDILTRVEQSRALPTEEKLSHRAT